MLKQWLAISLMLLVCWPAAPALAQTPLAIDGSYDDWDGRQNVSDSSGDGQSNNTEMIAFYWGTNPNDETLYFMVQRDSANGPAYYKVQIDANNDGDFSDAEDRQVQVHYSPGNKSADVEVTVLDGQGGTVGAGSGAGQTKKEGGSKTEFSVSFATLGISPNQAINMKILASQSDGFPNPDCIPDNQAGENDCEGTITDTPVPILGWLGIIALFVGVTGLAWHTHRKQQ